MKVVQGKIENILGKEQKVALLVLSQFIDSNKLILGGSLCDIINLSYKRIKNDLKPKDLDVMVEGWDSIRELEKRFKIIEALPSDHAKSLEDSLDLHIQQVYLYILGVKVDIFIFSVKSYKKVKRRKIKLLNQQFYILTVYNAIRYHKIYLHYFILQEKIYWQNKHGNRLDLYGE